MTILAKFPPQNSRKSDVVTPKGALAMSADIQEQNELQSVVFQLGNELYGIDIFRVNEIIRMREVTPLPGSEAYIRGLVNLRGKTIPVVDLANRLGLEVQEISEDTRIIVIDSDSGNVGIVVDAVREVVTVNKDQIDKAPAIMSDSNSDFVDGVAKMEGGLIALLSLDRALAA